MLAVVLVHPLEHVSGGVTAPGPGVVLRHLPPDGLLVHAV